jgi:hypothetical protein
MSRFQLFFLFPDLPGHQTQTKPTPPKHESAGTKQSTSKFENRY